MVMGPSAAYILPKALKDVQFNIVVGSDQHPRGVAWIHLAHNDPEGEG